MIFIDKPALAASSAGNTERLATTSYRKLLPKRRRPFAIVRIQPNMLPIYERSIHNTVSISLATFALSSKPPINATRHLLVEKEPPTKLDAKGNNNTLHSRNSPSTKSSYTKAQKISFSTEFARTCIYHSMTLWNTQNTFHKILYIAFGKESHAAIRDDGRDSKANICRLAFH